MGKIIETTYHDSVQKITGFNTALINNSFYTINDKKPVIITYYNINKPASSLDPGSKISYDNIGEYSSLRFNKINNFIIYGFNRIELQTENDEFGLEAEKISGDAYILPNTIIPTEGDFFEVEHITDNTWLFIVTDVQQDTLLNGSNAYKISYKLEYIEKEKINKNIVDTFDMIEKREGTNIVKIVKSSNLEKAKVLDKLAVTLKSYFCELFYNKYVQTFIYSDLTEWRIYDQYMIEFLIRNKILANGEDSFIHVTHQIEVPKTFSIEYDKTFYRYFEKKDKDNILSSNREVQLEDIVSYGTTFASRYETYFKTKYTTDPVIGYSIQCVSDDILYNIYDNVLIEDIKDLNKKQPLWINILIKHFSGEEITDEEIKSVYNMDFNNSLEAFYIIPLLILCIEDNMEKLLN